MDDRLEGSGKDHSAADGHASPQVYRRVIFYLVVRCTNKDTDCEHEIYFVKGLFLFT